MTTHLPECMAYDQWEVFDDTDGLKAIRMVCICAPLAEAEQRGISSEKTRIRMIVLDELQECWAWTTEEVNDLLRVIDNEEDPTPAPVFDPNYPSYDERPGGCTCHQCNEDANVDVWWMVVCATCGNKRCPHATDHRHDCTGSNATGQVGSIYGPTMRDDS